MVANKIPAALTALCLAGLWLTGLALIGLDTGLNPAALAAKPKLLAKLTVVGLLSLNGLALHRYAFPALSAPAALPKRAARWCALFGAISSVSWLYAAFVGCARLIAPWMDYTAFMALYAIALAVGISVSLLWAAARLHRVMAQRPAALAATPSGDSTDAAAASSPSPSASLLAS